MRESLITKSGRTTSGAIRFTGSCRGGYETKAKIGKADDGRYLIPIEKYLTTIRHGVGIIEGLLEHEATWTFGLDGALAQMVEITTRIENAAWRIEKAANADADE